MLMVGGRITEAASPANDGRGRRGLARLRRRLRLLAVVVIVTGLLEAGVWSVTAHGGPFVRLVGSSAGLQLVEVDAR